MLDTIKRLIELFALEAADRSTLDELHRMLDDRASWRGAHDLFRRIRSKTLEAGRRGDKQAETQYLFEEVCAETLYNLTRLPAPFDPDAPYWIVPNALTLARRLGIDEAVIVKIVAS